jgi:hypothetical protein
VQRRRRLGKRPQPKARSNERNARRRVGALERGEDEEHGVQHAAAVQQRGQQTGRRRRRVTAAEARAAEKLEGGLEALSGICRRRLAALPQEAEREPVELGVAGDHGGSQKGRFHVSTEGNTIQSVRALDAFAVWRVRCRRFSLLGSDSGCESVMLSL